MKLTVTRILETSRFLATDAGKQLQDFITYFADFANQVLLSLRNGLTYTDNMNSAVVTVSLSHETAQVVYSGVTTRPLAIHHQTVSSVTAISCLVWSLNQAGQLTVTPTFKGSPSGKISVVLVIVFG